MSERKALCTRSIFVAIVAMCAFGLVAAPAAGQLALDESCTLSILNRTARVQANGGWRLDNVPANFGPVRARATCVRDGLTVSGQSDLFDLAANVVNGFNPEISPGEAAPIPQALELTTPVAVLEAAGATARLTATARFADDSEVDVTAAFATTYTTSNSTIATVTADGTVTALSSGTVAISATYEGALGLVLVRVTLGGDSDGDGLPDDVELAVGLDPNDPIDALEDADGDGLSNRQELLDFATDPRVADSDGDGLGDGEEVTAGSDGFVTNPLLADSDGDGLSDGLEASLGSDPTDPTDGDIGAALVALEVSPADFVLVVDGLGAEVSTALSVTGQLSDGSTIDLTSVASGTNYASSDLFVCNFGAEDGRVFAGDEGGCTVTVTNRGFTARARGIVANFTPQAVAFLALPGRPESVAVLGDTAYVALNTAGLAVVDVSDRQAPVLVTTLATPSRVLDAKVFADLLYIAEATQARIFDLSDPRAPAQIALLPLTNARDVAKKGDLLAIARGFSGLSLYAVGDPEAPVELASRAGLGNVLGVDLTDDGALAVLAVATQGLRVLDLSDPQSPVVLAAIDTGDAKDVTVQDELAFVADRASSFTVVDLATPAAPTLVASTPLATGGLLEEIALDEELALGADIFFVNGVPIIDISDPRSPVPRAILDFSAIDDDNGFGIATDGRFAYLAAQAGSNGLYIGRHRPPVEAVGLAPEISITSPVPAPTLTVGDALLIEVEAVDDVGVAGVHFAVDGETVATDTAAPFDFFFTTELDDPAPAQVTVTATAIDFGGQTASAEVVVTLLPRPPPEIFFFAPMEGEALVEGETILVEVGMTSELPLATAELTVNGVSVPSLDPFGTPDGGGGLASFEPTGLLVAPFTVPFAAQSLDFTVTATDSAGAVGSASLVLPVVPDPESTVSGQVVDRDGLPVADAEVELRVHGLRAESFDFDVPLTELPALEGLTPDRVGVLSSPALLNPDGLLSPDAFGLGFLPDFAVRLSGFLRVEVPLEVTLKLVASDGARLELDGETLLETEGSPGFDAAFVELPAGDLPLRIEYFSNQAPGELYLTAEVPDFGEIAFLPVNFLASPSPLRATTDAVGNFTIGEVPVSVGEVQAIVRVESTSEELRGSSPLFEVEPGGITDLGTIVVSTPGFENDLGAHLSLGDDDVAIVDMPEGFVFPFFGSDYSEVFVNSNGNLTFGDGDFSFDPLIPNDIVFGLPRIAPLFTDLDPGQSFGVFTHAIDDHLVVTWVEVPQLGAANANTFQVILYSDGRLQIGYSGIGASGSGFAASGSAKGVVTSPLDIAVAVSPGQGAALREVDLTAAAPLSTNAGEALLEHFVDTDAFDLDNTLVLLTPNASGGYDLRLETGVTLDLELE